MRSSLQPSTSTASVVPAINEFTFIGEINKTKNKRYCSACRCDIPASDFNVEQHVEGERHKNNLKILISVRKSFSVFIS